MFYYYLPKNSFYGRAKNEIIKLETESHAPLCESMLKKIKAQYLLLCVSGDKHFSSCSKLAFEDSYKYRPAISAIHRGWSKPFIKSLDKLCDQQFIDAEIDFIKKNSQYHRFLTSPFYIELKEELNKFFSGDFDMKGYHLSEVACVKLFQVHGFKSFKMEFYTYDYSQGYDSDYGHCFEILREKYRPLSSVENSMLAIALSNDFPERFNLTWKVLTDYSTIELILAPIYRPVPRTEKTPTKTIRDLY